MHSLAPLLSPPVSEAQLLQQAQRLAGYSLGEPGRDGGVDDTQRSKA